MKKLLKTLCVPGSLLLAGLVMAAPPPAGVALIAPPPGGFGIDGDLLANVPDADVGDWVGNTNAPGTGLGVLDANGVPLDPLRTFHFVDAYNTTSDEIFKGGNKWPDNPNTWGWTTGKATAKTDINNVLLHVSSDADEHVWAVIAADRLSTAGDSYIDFEFFQNPVIKNANGTFTSAGPHGGRTTNDILLSLAFTGGGKVADFFAHRWVPSGSGYAYVDVTAALPAGRVFVALNTNTVATPYSAFGQMSYPANAFAEAAIDLTALFGNFDPCFSVGFNTIMVKTKASASASAGIEDFINPIQYILNIGPGADAGPDQVRCREGEVTPFALQGTASSGLQAVAATTWSVVSGDVTIDDPTSLITTARVSSASATLRLTVEQINGCTKTDDVVLAVQTPPGCNITGVSETCLRSTNIFSGPAGMNEYAWSISGNGVISGPANQASVAVIAGEECGGSYTLALVTRSNACTVACETEVLVVDTTLPTLTCPANVVLDCPAVTTTNVTGVATASDGCSRVTISFSDAVTTGCGVSQVIARTWTATDECGNSVSCVQTITVRDITPPVITCPPNRTLDCPADTSPAANGVATATDLCGVVNVTFSDNVTTNCGNTFVIARTWVATDLCGNQSSCVQTLTVRDVTPPVLTCPADVTLECPANTTTNATGRVTATDACGSVVITYTDAVTNNCGNTKVIKRAWVATDQCGNQSSCVQTITVRDTTPPVLTCPPNRVLDCPANTSTNATGMATATDACGSVTITYTDAVTNGCAGTKTIARTWVAVDQCGNQSTCVQTITVRDITPPTITCPPNVTLDCPAVTTTNVTGVATATDACGTVTITHADTVTQNCGNTYVISRRWTATDQCGNSSSCTQTITVRDITPPVITCPPNVTLECPAVTTTNVTGVATATDACGTVTISYTDSVANNCGNTRTITRTWRATDQCGNQSSCVQTITVRDITPPTLNIPANLTLECGASTHPNATGTATAQDACNSVTVSYSDSVTNLCGNTRVILRRWTAVDSCGNSNSLTQTITLQDTTPPVLTLPANRVLDCPGDTRTSVTGMATATDICGSVTISYSDTVTTNCGFARTVSRQWTATDQCGNSTSGLQTIIVRDTAPTISCPTLKVQCEENVPLPYANLAAFLAAGGSAAGKCDTTLTLTLISDTGLVGSCPGTVTRVYRVTDACGNYAQCTQTITVDDTIAPTLTCPGNVVVECGDSLDPADLGQATATDNCTADVTVTHSDTQVQSEYNLRFCAADTRPNAGPYSPTYLQLSPASLACPPSALLTGRATDPLRHAVAYTSNGQLDALTSLDGAYLAMGQIVPFFLVIEVGGGPGPERGTIEFTAGWNTRGTSNSRYGYDTNYMVYCAFVDAGDPGTIDPHFNARVESYSVTMADLNTSSEQIRGTFRVSGLDSGDRVIVEMWLVLMPTMPGNVGGTIGADLVSAQKATEPPQPISLGTQAIPLGSQNKISTLPAPQAQPPPPSLPPQPPVPPGGIVRVINRTWTATDDCGNRRTCVQQITVSDTMPPVVNCAANKTINGGEGLVFDPPTATDICDTPVISVLSTVTNAANGSTQVTRTWQIADLSGNAATCQQTITVLNGSPRLESRTAPARMMLLSWPAHATEYRLESTMDWKKWSPVPIVPTISNDLCVVLVPMTNAHQFFRITDAPPALDSQRGTAGKLRFTWPTAPSGFVLEASDSLSPANWTPVGITPVTSNLLHHVEVTPTGPRKFYRLKKTLP